VLPSINFDNEMFLAADEVADVAACRLLPHEFIAVDLPLADAIPQLRLRIGLIDA